MKTVQQRELSAEVEVALSAHFAHPVDVYSWLKSLTEMQRLMTEESEAEQVINALRAGLIHWIQQAADEKEPSAKNSSKTPKIGIIAADGNVVSLASRQALKRQAD